MGGLAYAYSTFDPIIIAVGHDTQMLSIGYMPAVLAGLILLFQKKYWVGFAVTAFFANVTYWAKPSADGVLYFDDCSYNHSSISY